MPEQDRQLAPPREPMQQRTSTGGTNAGDAPRTLDAMARRSYDRSIEVYDNLPAQATPNTNWAAQPLTSNQGQLAAYGQPDLSVNSGVSMGGQTQQPITPYYDINNPLGLSADLFSKFFSSAPVEGPQSPVLVGDTGASSGGGSNVGLLLIIALLGIGGYFIYRRMKQ